MEEGASYIANITFRNLQLPTGAWTNDAFHIVGSTILVIDGATNLQPGSISWTQPVAPNAQPVVIIRNSTYYHPSGTVMDADDVFDFNGSSRIVKYRVEGCVQVSGSDYTIIADSSEGDMDSAPDDGWREINAGS
jgi:hypothetical protein